MKSAVPELIVMADVCVDEYTDHGHCGILRNQMRRLARGALGGRQRRDGGGPPKMGVVFAKSARTWSRRAT